MEKGVGNRRDVLFGKGYVCDLTEISCRWAQAFLDLDSKLFVNWGQNVVVVLFFPRWFEALMKLFPG